MRSMLVLLVLIACSTCVAQNQLISPISTSRNFKNNFSFTHEWSYPWQTIKNDEGFFSTASGDTLTAEDTVHLFHTAKALTDHQGEHEVRYFDAWISNDTVYFSFQPELPAYASSLSGWIFEKKFASAFQAYYPAPVKNLQWHTQKQKIILNKVKFHRGDVISGYIETEFTESSGDHSRNYFFRGYFKTRVH